MALQATGNRNGSSRSGSSSHNENLMAAADGALATALVESPVELFRHQAQAGVGGGNFLQEMVNTVHRKVGIKQPKGCKGQAGMHQIPAEFA